MKDKIAVIISILRSLWFNFKFLPFSQARKLPILLGKNLYVSVDGGVKIQNERISFGMIRLGLNEGSLGIQTNSKSFLVIPKESVVMFKGRAIMSRGFTIRNGNNAIVTIGDHFFSNQNFQLFSSTQVTIGNDVLIGWDVQMRDSDGHKIFKVGDTQVLNSCAPVCIGNHVWVGANVRVLKGVNIPDDTIIAMGAMVTSSVDESNTIAAGIPAKIIKRNITWEK